MGNEIKRDMCPEKYYGKGSVVKNVLPILIALLIVDLFSGDLLVNGAGMDRVVTIIMDAVVAAAFYGIFTLLFKKMGKSLAATYISVCEYGVCGICPINGYKNRNFELAYNEITKMTVKGERMVLYSPKGNVSLTLKDAAGTAALIKARNANL